jgi:membrane protein implicated in regulation of membrane protease activity
MLYDIENRFSFSPLSPGFQMNVMIAPIEVWQIWMGAGVLLIAAEIVVPGFIVFWFGVGAIAAGVPALIGFGEAVQWATFVAVSGVLLVLRHKIVQRITKRQLPGIGASRLVGMRGPITIAVDNLKGTGHVRLGGELWRAESRSGAQIRTGSVVEVVAVEGIRVVVAAIREET